MGKKKGKILILILLMAGMSWMGYRVAHAYFADQDELKNDFRVGKNEIEPEEPFDPPEPGKKTVKEPRAVNTGTVDCYVRGRIVLSDSRAEPYLEYYTGEMSGFNTDSWEKGTDGWLYYKQTLQIGQTTEPVFTHIKVKKGIPEELTEGFTVDVLFESVQSDGFANPQKAFRSLESGRNGQGGER